MLGLDLAASQVDTDPQAARSLLKEVKAETVAAVEEIRRLVYELRPPALDLGLAGAVRCASRQSAWPDATPPLPPQRTGEPATAASGNRGRGIPDRHRGADQRTLPGTGGRPPRKMGSHRGRRVPACRSFKIRRTTLPQTTRAGGASGSRCVADVCLGGEEGLRGTKSLSVTRSAERS